MRSAVLKISTGGEKLRFEVQSTPHHRPGTHHHLGPQPPSNSGVQKWYMKANHPAEVARWTQAIKKSIEWYQTRHGNGLMDISHDQSNRSGILSDASSVHTSNKSGKHLRRGSTGSSGENDTLEPAEMSGRYHPEPEDTHSLGNSSTSGSVGSPPHTDMIDLQGNTTMAQLELTSKLLATVTFSASDGTLSNDVEEAVKESFAHLQGLMGEYIRMAKEREEWYKEKLNKERDRTTMWEESLSAVVREGEALERELRKRERLRPKRRSPADRSDPGSSTVRRRITRALPPLPNLSTTGFSDAAATTLPSGLVDEQTPASDHPSTVSLAAAGTDASQQLSSSDKDGVDTDEEDEFFDAIELNNLPNLIVSGSLRASVSPLAARTPSTKPNPYQGYSTLRDRLPIKSDDRPSTSLWQVLKGSIGKDLTKISFPVYFNEPTSMLQRMVSEHGFVLDGIVTLKMCRLRIWSFQSVVCLSALFLHAPVGC